MSTQVPVPDIWDGARFEYRAGFDQAAQGERCRCPVRKNGEDAEFRIEAWRAGHREGKRLRAQVQNELEAAEIGG